MPSGSFSVDAWIVGGRMRHHRTHDHFGTETDAFVVLSAPIGKYTAGMTVSDVLRDMVTRIVALEGGTHRVGSFTAAAFIQPYFRADAVILKARSGTFTMDAVFGRGGKFTVDAVVSVPRSGSFTFDAYIV